MFRTFHYFLAALLVASVAGQEVKNVGFPLSYKADLGCVEMIATHAFNGDCCSLKATADEGCVLVVVNGNCVVNGPIWEVDYTSTYDSDSCPTSAFTDLPTKLASLEPEGAEGSNISSAPKSFAVLSLVLSAFAYFL
ncbi:unnamed protein product [Cylindrotheca closterium]|uniref:Uncharacterized protein n=1 Tax=Cylindrotheca closterium TaxID=2856 RepID=A0AAD2PV27_9STRA|nr:unnamed protein product [Cylindrotheca closterium]